MPTSNRATPSVLRASLLSDAERMTAPIAGSTWTRQGLIDGASRRLTIPRHQMTRPVRNALRELCSARILYCTSNRGPMAVYVLQNKSNKRPA